MRINVKSGEKVKREKKVKETGERERERERAKIGKKRDVGRTSM